MKVSLREIGATSMDRIFTYKTTPTISEAQTVEYKQFNPVHAPGSINTFVNSPSRTFSFGDVKLISRTQREATETLKNIRLLRSWTKPVFGLGVTPDAFKNDPNSFSNEDILGAPPRVLFLSAYTNHGDVNGILKNIPVVVTSLTFNYPNDVDYMILQDGSAVPVVMNVEISVTETHSPIEYTKFSLAKYRNGDMVRF